MSPLRVEAEKEDGWVSLPDVGPEDRPGSFSHNTGDGREVYIFQCAQDDSHSVIYRSAGGLDMATRQTRRIVPLEEAGLEEVKTLESGERYEMKVNPDMERRLPEDVSVRFTHYRP